jgi:hypothetical protein
MPLLNLVHREVYLIQHYVIKFVSDLRHVGGFFWVLRFIKLTTLSLKGLATTVDVSKKFLWSVPDNWSLDGAATVPVVYTTAFYALVVRILLKVA